MWRSSMTNTSERKLKRRRRKERASFSKQKRRKNKNMINDEGDRSAAANKRRRTELLNGMITRMPLTNLITDFPSIHLRQQPHNPLQNTTAIGADLRLSPPAVDDDPLSFLIPQQNFFISYHINQMRQNVEEFWRRNFDEEVKKRKEMEARLKQKHELVDRFRQMYYFYKEKVLLLEEMLQRSLAGEQHCSAAAASQEEEVESSFVELNSVGRMEMACSRCRSRPATKVWLPCRHLCVCLVCERRAEICPICGVHKTESLSINLP